MNVFVARQPIFDQRRKVYAYELLFRSGLENFFDHADPDQATSSVISDSVSVLSLEQMTGGQPAFINFTQGLIEAGLATLLPREWLVVEILEDVEPTREVLEACADLKKKGYLLALDDFVFQPRLLPLMEMADILKVDFRHTDSRYREDIAAQARAMGIKAVAEKVENEQEFTQAKAYGYDYFQGYFFCKPTIITGRDIPAWKMQSLQLLKEVQAHQIKFKNIAEIIRQEISLTYKLLRYINSPFFGVRIKIDSVNQALVMLGEENVRKWLSMVAMANLAREGTPELSRNSFIRATLCESLGTEAGLGARATDLFMVGLFSLIEVVLSRSMPEIMSELPLPDDVAAALLGGENHLRRILDLAVSYDRGEWDRCSALASAVGLAEDRLPALYLEALARVQALGAE
ncbi:MAG: EAL domain-containing protein [Proteobacteria bacterium]|nr:EAL domain-containing protein [Pseudomonadota bacterium]